VAGILLFIDGVGSIVIRFGQKHSLLFDLERVARAGLALIILIIALHLHSYMSKLHLDLEARGMSKLSSALIFMFLVGPFVSLGLWIWEVMQLWNQLLMWTIETVFLLIGMIVWLGLTIVWLIFAIILLTMK